MATGKTVRARGRRRWKWLTWSIVLALFLVCSGVVTSQVGLWRARVAIEARQHHSADTWLTIARFSWPRDAEWYYLSAIVNRRLLKFESVEQCLTQAHKLGWRVADLEREQTLAHAQTGQFHKVGNQWGGLLMTAGSDGPEICRAYAGFALARFQLNEAATVIELWKADFPNDPGPYVVEGDITSVLLRWAEAEALYLEALERDFELYDVRTKLAQVLMKQLKFGQAEEQLRMVLRADSAASEVQASLAHCVAQQGSVDDAMEILESGLDRDADNVRLLAEFGRLAVMAGDNTKAIESLSDVLEKEPENTELRYSYAQALRNAGREKEAQEHFRLVDEGTKALLHLSKMTETVVQDPSDVEARFQVASTTWRWKSRTEGVKWLGSILAIDPNHRETHALLAEHYEKTGDLEKAAHHRLKIEDK